jgi:hypothetical protein
LAPGKPKGQKPFGNNSHDGKNIMIIFPRRYLYYLLDLQDNVVLGRQLIYRVLDDASDMDA